MHQKRTARALRWHFFPQFSKVIVTPQKPFDEEQLYFGRTKVDNNGSSSEKNVPHACVTNASRGGDLSRSLLLSYHHTHHPFETNLQTTAGKNAFLRIKSIQTPKKLRDDKRRYKRRRRRRRRQRDIDDLSLLLLSRPHLLLIKKLFFVFFFMLLFVRDFVRVFG